MATLYINGHETEVKVSGRKLEVTRFDEANDDIQTMNVPLFDLDRVVVVGRPAITVPMLQACAREAVPVVFTTTRGKWVGSFFPDANGHALRRLRQYELAKDRGFALAVARQCVCAKIRNSRRVLQRLAASRSRSDAPEQVDACNSLQSALRNARGADELESLRGYEGLAGATYFRRLATFFPDDLPFTGRSRRPPRDGANALMSWTYTIVLGEIEAAIRAAGLDPCLGFLHEISHGRASLALDLLEPLRPALCDLLVLSIFNHGILKTKHFEVRTEDGGTYLKAEARKTFFTEYEKTMLRRFAPAKGQPHTDFRGAIRRQVNTLLQAMETLDPEPFFEMP